MPDPRSPHVAIVDYGMGNLYSVQRACDHVGLSSELATSPERVLAADGVILPGVGAMPQAMDVLDRTGLSDAIRAAAAGGTPTFAVCLGLQLLMREGSEFSPHAGLGIIDGIVARLSGADDVGSPLRVPHIGWNRVEPPAGAAPRLWDDTPLAPLGVDAYMYFVHSYYVVPADPGVVLATTRYGNTEFCSAVRQGAIFACQFHPERSGPLGLSMYESFAAAVSAAASIPFSR
jgi:imidazole glycerol-phosphate synthase subunit HisH